MKNTFLTLVFVLSLNAFAQTHQLVKHDGDEYQVNFIKYENNLIYYSNPESQEQQKISSNAVSSLKNIKTSEEIIVSPKIAVTSKADYKEVKVLQNEDHAVGLKKAATFTGQLNRTKGISPANQFAYTTQRIKKRAAAEGYLFVAINKKGNGAYEAIAYTY